MTIVAWGRGFDSFARKGKEDGTLEDGVDWRLYSFNKKRFGQDVEKVARGNAFLTCSCHNGHPSDKPKVKINLMVPGFITRLNVSS